MQAAAYRHAAMLTLKHLAWVGIAAGTAFAAEVACTAAEHLAGRPKIIDGDSFEIGAVGVRLFGVDAPEGRQSCTRSGRNWPCGEAAAAQLRRLVGSRDVICEQRDVDAYGRIVAVCRVGPTDLGAAMVSAGFAVAYERYSDDYVDEERDARAARRGVWAGEFTPPEQYRRDERPAQGAEPQRSQPPQQSSEPAQRAPREARRDGCHIKGNINARGAKIYHTPDSASYGETVIDESRGERWFCTETEARGAGWRAPRG
jgi:endonuclease YncB( thermonuclease family)